MTRSEESYETQMARVVELAEQAKRTGVPVILDLPDLVVQPSLVKAFDLVIPPDSMRISLNEEDA